MQALDSERTIAPRSALRYRPITTDQAGGTGPVIMRKTRARPDVRTAAAVQAPDDLDQEEDKPSIPIRRRKVAPAPLRSVPPPARRRPRLHPLFFIGVGLGLSLCLWVGATQVISWGTNELNSIKYGYPRTFQMDAVLGHNDSAARLSHLEAMNLHGQILIIEIPGGDPTHARIYVGPQLLGANADLIPVTLRLIDPYHTGYPDIVIDAGGMQSVLINIGSGGGFRSPTPAELQQLQPSLQ